MKINMTVYSFIVFVVSILKIFCCEDWFKSLNVIY